MNRKKSAVIALCAMLVGAGALAGCGTSNPAPTSSVVSQAPPRVDTPSNPEINKGLTLTEYSLTEGNIILKFPLVAGMDVPEQGNPVNTMIQQDIIAAAKMYPEGEGTFEYEVIYNDGKILSLLYTGTVTTKDAASPVNAAFTTNINIETRERISSGAPEKASEIAALLVSGEGYTVKGDSEELQQAIVTALKAMDPKTLTDSIAAADFAPDKQPTVFSAYAGEQKVIVLLPVEHAIGDVACITIDWAPPAPEEPVNSEPANSEVNASQPDSESSSSKASSEPLDTPVSTTESGAEPSSQV